MAGALDELFPSMMSDSSTFFDDNFGELAAAAAATVHGSTFELAFSFRRRSSAPSLAMPFSPEETPRPCLHQRTPPLLQARRLAARATGISGFYSVKTNAMGSGAGSSSVEARGARELLFKMGDEVHVRGDPYAPFVDTDSWCSGTRKHQGHLPGLCSPCGGVAGHEQRGMEQRESPRWRCRWGPSERRKPGAPLWCGCFSSPTPVLGAAALDAAWGISLGFVLRAAASLGSNSEAWSSARSPVGAAG